MLEDLMPANCCFCRRFISTQGHFISAAPPRAGRRSEAPKGFGNVSCGSFQGIIMEQRILLLSESAFPPKYRMGRWLRQVRRRKRSLKLARVSVPWQNRSLIVKQATEGILCNLSIQLSKVKPFWMTQIPNKDWKVLKANFKLICAQWETPEAVKYLVLFAHPAETLCSGDGD